MCDPAELTCPIDVLSINERAHMTNVSQLGLDAFILDEGLHLRGQRRAEDQAVRLRAQPLPEAVHGAAHPRMHVLAAACAYAAKIGNVGSLASLQGSAKADVILSSDWRAQTFHS